MSDSTTKFIVIPVGFDIEQVVGIMNQVSQERIGVDLMYDTPDDAVQAQADYPTNKGRKQQPIEFAQVSFRRVTAPVVPTPVQ